jgi:hypothetical protein
VSIYYAKEERGLVQSDTGTDAESEGKQQSIRVRQEYSDETIIQSCTKNRKELGIATKSIYS